MIRYFASSIVYQSLIKCVHIRIQVFGIPRTSSRALGVERTKKKEIQLRAFNCVDDKRMHAIFGAWSADGRKSGVGHGRARETRGPPDTQWQLVCLNS
jgi:hypothetical protein